MSLEIIEDTSAIIQRGFIDPAIPWVAMDMVHGGYSLSLVVDSVVETQKGTSQPDVVHISAHYQRHINTGPYEVHIRRTKPGKGISYLDADLVQKGKVRIASRFVVGVLPDLTKLPTDTRATIHPTSSLARHIPLSTHPGDAYHSFVDLTADLPIKLAEEGELIRKTALRASNQQSTSLYGPIGDRNGGTEWGAWCELSEYPGFDGSLTPANLAIAADISVRPVYLLPFEQQPGPSWPATIVLDIEFKSKIPEGFAPKTVGIYSTGKFMFKGQHDLGIEVWTAPCGVSEEQAERDPNWREKQVCLAVSHQLVTVIPQDLRAKPAVKAKL